MTSISGWLKTDHPWEVIETAVAHGVRSRVAGICSVSMAVVTRNVRDFEDMGIEIFDPLVMVYSHSQEKMLTFPTCRATFMFVRSGSASAFGYAPGAQLLETGPCGQVWRPLSDWPSLSPPRR